MTKTSIYDQHRASFPLVSAFIVAKGGERVATVAIKFPRDGAGRLFAYVHWIGIEMVRGYANGYGYDKRTAACCAAIGRMPASLDLDTYADGTPHHSEAERADYAAFSAALKRDDGTDWDRHLRDAGFDVWQAV